VLQLVIIVQLVLRAAIWIRHELVSFELDIWVVQGVEIISTIRYPEKEVQTIVELVHCDVQVDAVLDLRPPFFGEKSRLLNQIDLTLLIDGNEGVCEKRD
jgi:hypothetical protein